MRFFRTFLSNRHAQTAIELALFGAILVFVLGVIIRQSLNYGYTQNQYLRAMRMAMTMSYKYSEGLMGFADNASRNNATVILLEDRLSVASGKYAAIDRIPFVMNSSASMSRHLFRPMDNDSAADLEDNLPAMDVFVNGKHFPFTLAGIKKITLVTADGKAAPGYEDDWIEKCVTKKIPIFSACVREDCIQDCPNYQEFSDGTVYCNVEDEDDPVSSVSKVITKDYGCVKFYSIVNNHVAISDWCDDVDEPCPKNNLSAKDRFDLDRDGKTDVPAGEWNKFGWQWFAVAGIQEDIWDEGLELNFAEGICLTGKNGCSPKFINIDVDRDLKEERIVSIESNAQSGVIQSVTVIDPQDGDWDPTLEGEDAPAFSSDVTVYTNTKEGMYLKLEEGRLFDPSPEGDRYIRTAQKKDQVDVVERVVRISNDTDRFCGSSGEVVNWSRHMRGINQINPVEACNQCNRGENRKKTCMEEDGPNGHPVIFIRSHIKDQRGHKWITNIEKDNHIDIDVPKQ